MTIIQANQSHLDQVAPLFDAYRVFYKQQSNLETAKQFLKQRLEKQDSIILIAYAEHEPVGFTQLFYSFSSVSMQPLFILNDLYVKKNYRKQGFGLALLNEAKTLCKNHNYKGLALQTETTNPAQKLYERLGWTLDKDLHYFWTNQ
ncbi:GNAT family N-acetyltransferase [Olleya aquimaris]|uniref:Acetyltransferase (GNAT) family protein n=1 Tax=Olleya aquimaris TaxID=639310 RepID=A0A327RTU9_9FLAO|nr:GNAT family N-acetyltransferase [Olleya aquimaris]RAJ17087.1 acetyltransferase (GNAT) family protein [Olleya aquimaris]